MIIELVRYKHGKDSTLGLLSIDGEFECYSLEDQFRETKVKGETRIPEGSYRVQFRTVDSPATLRYRKKFDWFTYHLQLMDVSGFEWIYIHYGNDHTDSDGCILTGTTVDHEKFFQGSSVKAFKKMYLKVSEALHKGEPVTINVIKLC